MHNHLEARDHRQGALLPRSNANAFAFLVFQGFLRSLGVKDLAEQPRFWSAQHAEQGGDTRLAHAGVDGLLLQQNLRNSERIAMVLRHVEGVHQEASAGGAKDPAGAAQHVYGSEAHPHDIAVSGELLRVVGVTGIHHKLCDVRDEGLEHLLGHKLDRVFDAPACTGAGRGR